MPTARAVALFNDIEDFGHEFDAAFKTKSIPAARTGTRRLLSLLTQFNTVVKGTDCEFSVDLLVAVSKVDEALARDDWEAAQKAAQHNETFAREFKRIGQQVVAVAEQRVLPEASSRP